VISCFRREVDNRASLGYYAASSGVSYRRLRTTYRSKVKKSKKKARSV